MEETTVGTRIAVPCNLRYNLRYNLIVRDLHDLHDLHDLQDLSLPRAPCPVPRAPCPVPRALCSVPCALCPVLCALCPVPRAPCQPPRDFNYYLITFVLPPFSILISTTAFVFHAPRVKSGTGTGYDLLSTDHSLKGAIALQSAASYTS